MTETQNRRGHPKWKIEQDTNGEMKLEWAEKFLIGTLLVNFGKHFPEIGDFDASKIHSEFHRAVFATMIELHSESRPVDVVAVADRLQFSGDMEGFDSPILRMLEMMDNSEGWAEGQVSEWCRIVWSHAARRDLKRELKELERLADIEPEIDALRSRISKISDRFPKERRRAETTLQEAVEEYASGLERGETETVRWGIPGIDAACGGFAAGEMVIIGARPSHGKSLIAMQWLDTAAAAGIAGLMISEEMSALSLSKRALQSIVPYESKDWGIDINRLRFEIRTHYEGHAPIVIAENCGKIDAVERAVDNAVRKYGIKLAVLDYAQLVKGDGGSRYEQVSDVSTRVKRLATKHGLIFLLLAQLSRRIESREDSVPQLSDLKDSGQLEQDADVILFPQWPIKSDPKHKDPYEYRIFQAKNRNRGIGNPIIQLSINPVRQRLEAYQGFGDECDDRPFNN